MNLSKLRLLEKRINVQYKKLNEENRKKLNLNVLMTKEGVNEGVKNIKKTSQELMDNIEKIRSLKEIAVKIRLEIKQENIKNGIEEKLAKLSSIDSLIMSHEFILQHSFSGTKIQADNIESHLLSRLETLKDVEAKELWVSVLENKDIKILENNLKALKKQKTQIEDDIAVINAKTNVQFTLTEEDKNILDNLDIIY